MSGLAETTRRSVADNMNLFVAVAAIIASLAWMTGSLRNEMDSIRGEIDARFDGIDVRLDGMDDRFDGIDDRLDRIGNRLERMDGQLYDLTSRLGRVESGVLGYEPPVPLEIPSEDDSSQLPETTPEPDPVAGL